MCVMHQYPKKERKKEEEQVKGRKETNKVGKKSKIEIKKEKQK